MAERRCSRTRIVLARTSPASIGSSVAYHRQNGQYLHITMSPTTAVNAVSRLLRLPSSLRCHAYQAISQRWLSGSQSLRAGGHENPLVRTCRMDQLEQLGIPLEDPLCIQRHLLTTLTGFAQIRHTTQSCCTHEARTPRETPRSKCHQSHRSQQCKGWCWQEHDRDEPGSG